MNEPRPNAFDAGNAAKLCEASAAAYLECGDMSPPLESGDISGRSTDIHVRITRTDSDLIIAFRGTTDVRNWLTDLDCAWDLEDGCRVHRGFARALDSVQSQISAEIFSPRRGGRRVWLAGHSLGGALAMLYAWRFFNTYHQLPFAGIYTFGQPRVGNSAFRDIYNSSAELFWGTFRIVHADDVIPRIPWLLGAYRHAGHEVFFTAPRAFGAFPTGQNWMADPTLLAKLPWDIRNAVREVRQGKVALLADHHVDSYLELFQPNRAEPALRAKVSEPGRVCP
jgi:pimeloyl-ACP methyl ester carboxylesterase